jgi:hypothetical protein
LMVGTAVTLDRTFIQMVHSVAELLPVNVRVVIATRHR